MRRPAPELVADERGTSLLEVVVTSALLLFAFAAILPMLISMQKTVVVTDMRGRTNDEAHVALAQLERDVRSGNVLNQVLAGGTGVTIYTQDDGPPFRCVRYTVAGGELRRSQRLAGGTDAWSAPAVVAEGLTTATGAFAISADGQTLQVDLSFDQGESSRPLRLATSITGRNTTYYDTPFSEGYCA
jgi:Tfp pilus assembly protein PilW